MGYVCARTYGQERQIALSVEIYEKDAFVVTPSQTCRQVESKRCLSDSAFPVDHTYDLRHMVNPISMCFGERSES